MSSECDYLLKTVLVGDAGKSVYRIPQHILTATPATETGKSCLLHRYTSGSFACSLPSSVGVDFSFVRMICDESSTKARVWDNSGRQQFRYSTTLFCRNAHAIAIVYDICNRVSFLNARQWLKDVKQHASSTVVIYLIGNKCDDASKRVSASLPINASPNSSSQLLLQQVTCAEGEAMARKLGVDGFCEVSALTGEGVKEAFDSLHTKAVQSLKAEAARRHSMAQQVAARPTSLKVKRSALQVNIKQTFQNGSLPTVLRFSAGVVKLS
jgi:Ras-related protein Rab-11A